MMTTGRYVLTGSVVACIAAAWVALTRTTGLTYHFFPPVIAAAAPALPAFLYGLSLSPRTATWLVLGGGASVTVAWLTMVGGGFAPTATFVTGQPGGVLGEVVVFVLLGAYRGAVYARRPR